jgi:hypothetical protein
MEHELKSSKTAPFTCPAGPGILPFFDGCGPFKRWLPPSEQITLEVMRLGTSSAAMSPEVESLVRSTVLRIQASGGRVVGLIGFSQGTKVVAGLLRASEYRREHGIQDKATQWCDFDLALSVCASYPPPVFPSFLPENEREKRKITTPTFHVQGKQDEWNWAGKGMIEKYYDIGEGKSKVIELDMGHHYPVAVEESEMIAEWMLATYKKAAEKR